MVHRRTLVIRKPHPYGFWLQFQRKPSKTKLVARGRQTTRGYSVYSFLLLLTRRRHLSLCHRLSAGYRKFSLPPFHLAPLFRMTLSKSFMVPKTRVFQAADSEDLVILACSVFDWSTSVTDGWTELRWQRCATAVAAVACKNWLYLHRKHTSELHKVSPAIWNHTLIHTGKCAPPGQAGTWFTYPGWMEDWVHLCGFGYTLRGFTCLNTVIHLGTNKAWQIATTLFRSDMLTTRPSQHQNNVCMIHYTDMAAKSHNVNNTNYQQCIFLQSSQLCHI